MHIHGTRTPCSVCDTIVASKNSDVNKEKRLTFASCIIFSLDCMDDGGDGASIVQRLN